MVAWEPSAVTGLWIELGKKNFRLFVFLILRIIVCISLGFNFHFYIVWSSILVEDEATWQCGCHVDKFYLK